MEELLQNTPSENGTQPEADLVAHLKTILSSQAFENATALKSLLQYLFQHRSSQLSEYTVGVEALGRRASFDPQVEATVRVQISRLRRRLKDFYLAEGSTLPFRFTIPLGSHRLVLEETQAQKSRSDQWNRGADEPESLTPDGAIPHPTSHHSPLTMVLIAIVLLLSGLCGWLSWKLVGEHRELGARTTPEALLPLWQQFCDNNKPIQIVIPNPTFFMWGLSPHESINVRNPWVNNFSDLSNSPVLSQIEKEFGPPQLTQNYAVSSDVVASLKLMHYMDVRGIKADITISSNTPSEMLDANNIVLVGTPGTLTPFMTQLSLLHFHFDPQATTIKNDSPHRNEEREYSIHSESPRRVITPGLIAVLPGPTPNSRVMLLTGRSTAALVSFITSKLGNQQLQEARQHEGGGPYFEVVVLSEEDGNTTLYNHLAAVRTYSDSTEHH